jgi:hypothetical protein
VFSANCLAPVNKHLEGIYNKKLFEPRPRMVIIEMRVNDPADDTEFHIFLDQACEGLKSKNSDVAALFYFPRKQICGNKKINWLLPADSFVCSRVGGRERERIKNNNPPLPPRLAPRV